MSPARQSEFRSAAGMQLDVAPDAETAARQAALFIARLAREAVQPRGRFVLAVSGGHTPRRMFEILAAGNLPWAKVELVQADERLAPFGDADRNLTSLQKNLLAHVPFPPQQVHPMPVEAGNPITAARQYAEVLQKLAGLPPVLDLVHLGLGEDGHTASLVPGDPVLDVTDTDVALTAIYSGRRRMTLTYPIINRARHILWLVTGREKAVMLSRMYKGDTGIPAGRINRERAVVFADQAAAAQVTSGSRSVAL